jgi:mannosyltransferase OCH1-like enzyme
MDNYINNIGTSIKVVAQSVALKSLHSVRTQHPSFRVDVPAIFNFAQCDNDICLTYDAAQIIPKKIWMYWEGERSIHLELCILTVQKWNPEFEIIIVTPDNVDQYIPSVYDEKLDAKKQLKYAFLHPLWNQIACPAQKADVVRTMLGLLYGGIWLDCDSICFDSLASFVERANNEKKNFIVWQREKTMDINNALMMTSPGHPIMQQVAKQIHIKLNEKITNNEINEIRFESWTEIGSNLLLECVSSYVWWTRDNDIYSIDIRSTDEIEPFEWQDTVQWVETRTNRNEIDICSLMKIFPSCPFPIHKYRRNIVARRVPLTNSKGHGLII